MSMATVKINNFFNNHKYFVIGFIVCLIGALLMKNLNFGYTIIFTVGCYITALLLDYEENNK